MAAVKQCSVSDVPGNAGKHERVEFGRKGRENFVELKKVAVLNVHRAFSADII